MEEIDPQLPLSSIRGIDEVLSAALARQRVLMWLVAALGGVALFLAAIGIHALIASGVTERSRELGIRLALGATVNQTIVDAAKPGILMAMAGLVIGSAMAYGASGLDAQLALGRPRQRSAHIRRRSSSRCWWSRWRPACCPLCGSGNWIRFRSCELSDAVGIRDRGSGSGIRSEIGRI